MADGVDECAGQPWTAAAVLAARVVPAGWQKSGCGTIRPAPRVIHPSRQESRSGSRPCGHRDGGCRRSGSGPSEPPLFESGPFPRLGCAAGAWYAEVGHEAAAGPPEEVADGTPGRAADVAPGTARAAAGPRPPVAPSGRLSCRSECCGTGPVIRTVAKVTTCGFARPRQRLEMRRMQLGPDAPDTWTVPATAELKLLLVHLDLDHALRLDRQVAHRVQAGRCRRSVIASGPGRQSASRASDTSTAVLVAPARFGSGVPGVRRVPLLA
jgi:hypothetical protein